MSYEGLPRINPHRYGAENLHHYLLKYWIHLIKVSAQYFERWPMVEVGFHSRCIVFHDLIYLSRSTKIRSLQSLKSELTRTSLTRSGLSSSLLLASRPPSSSSSSSLRSSMFPRTSFRSTVFFFFAGIGGIGNSRRFILVGT